MFSVLNKEQVFVHANYLQQFPHYYLSFPLRQWHQVETKLQIKCTWCALSAPWGKSKNIALEPMNSSQLVGTENILPCNKSKFWTFS